MSLCLRARARARTHGSISGKTGYSNITQAGKPGFIISSVHPLAYWDLMDPLAVVKRHMRARRGRLRARQGYESERWNRGDT